MNEQMIKTKPIFYETLDYYKNNLSSSDNVGLAKYLIKLYVNGDFKISDLSKQIIYNEVIKIYCEQILRRNSLAKFELGKELFLENYYLNQDKELGYLLITLAAYEGNDDACHFLAMQFRAIGRFDIQELILKSDKSSSKTLLHSINLYLNEGLKKLF